LRFFLDHCISNSVAETLQHKGHEVSRLREYLPTDSVDPDVIAKAQELDAILVSLNGDFADITVHPSSSYQGIVALQVKNHPEIEHLILETFCSYLKEHPNRDHYRGKLLVVDSHRIRTRR
jgi:predicted nuclease of predicted toxin-antitoxin system